MTRTLTTLTALACLTLLALPMAAKADLKFFEDPAYQQINKDDPNPMQDMIDLANQGDPRAQFILGDLYSKGQGGLGRNRVKGRYWFETAARNGYTMAFIRLAAQSKRAHDVDSTYKWYALAATYGTASEQAWSKDQLNQLVQSAKLTKKDIKEDDLLVKDWLQKSVGLLKEQKAREAHAREVIKASATANEDNIIDPANVPVPDKSTPTARKQEFRYND